MISAISLGGFSTSSFTSANGFSRAIATSISRPSFFLSVFLALYWGGPLVGPKSQCVHGPENEIAAVTFLPKTGAALTNSSALASPTEDKDPGERLLTKGLTAPPGAKERVANPLPKHNVVWNCSSRWDRQGADRRKKSAAQGGVLLTLEICAAL